MGEGPFFQLHVSMKIHLSCLARFVAKPKSNDAEVYATVQQRHGRRVSQRVRFHLLGFERWAALAGGGNVFRHEALQCVGAESSAI